MPLFRTLSRGLLLAAALLLPLAGCGRRGPLEPPPAASPSNAPLTGAPDAVALPKNTPDPTAAKAEPAPPPAPPQPAAPRTFFLDPLL